MSIFSSLTGTLVNVATVLLGSSIGMLVGKGLPPRLSRALMTALGFCTVYIGISGCFGGGNTLVVVLSLVVGAALGELINPDKWLTCLSEKVENRFNKKVGHTPIAQGLVTSSLVFCVGAMTIVGSLNSGLSGDHTMLYTKACLDLVSSTVFASTMGFGVMLSAGVVFVLQGGIALLAHGIAPFLGEAVIATMTAVGSILIVGLGLNLLGVSKFKIMNFVPAVFLPMLFCPLYDLVAAWLTNWL